MAYWRSSNHFVLLLVHRRGATGLSFSQRRSFVNFSGIFQPVLQKYSERRRLRFTPEHVYAVVADVENYRHFVPWCRKSVITSRKPRFIEAELTVGFQLFSETYASHVSLDPEGRSIRAVSTNTQLFERLETSWSFEPDPGSVPPACFASIRVEFAFRSALYAQTSQLFLDEVAGAMLGAFERRCGVVPMAAVAPVVRAVSPRPLQTPVALPGGSPRKTLTLSPQDRPARVPHAQQNLKSIEQPGRPGQLLGASRPQPSTAARLTPQATADRRAGGEPAAPPPLPAPLPRPASRIQRRATRISPFPALPSDSLW